MLEMLLVIFISILIGTNLGQFSRAVDGRYPSWRYEVEHSVFWFVSYSGYLGYLIGDLIYKKLIK